MGKRRPLHRIVVAITVIAAVIWISGNQLFARENSDKRTTATASPSGRTPKSGEQIFMENCSRCHKPPMSISPRTTGTVVMHMRVRAKLSRQDEQALLRYLAP